MRDSVEMGWERENVELGRVAERETCNNVCYYKH